jgi:hypothetical protein
MIITDKQIIYGVLFLFAVFMFQWLFKRRQRQSGVREGMSVLADTATTAEVEPVPINTSEQTQATNSKTATSKLSACGDSCDAYDGIQAALDSFKKIYTLQEDSTTTVRKVDQDIIKLSESVKNMGNTKVPGGNPKVTKEMLV